MTNRVGQRLGHYHLLRLLGEGGFASVYLGEHVYLQTQAAIKILATRLSPGDRARFLSEARTIARLKHPHIVRVLEFGVEGDTPYLVMDYAPGGTMRTRHPKGTRVPLDAIRGYLQQVGDAVQYAHEHQVVHRDLKPENLLLGERGEVFLSDFGIAVVSQSSRSEQTAEVAGTVVYMAPEQIQGKPRPASDQYALGILLYEWLTGTAPFGGSFTEIASQHLLAPPPSLRAQRPELSPLVEQVVLIALAKAPKDRFATVQALARAFEQACQAAPMPPSVASVPSALTLPAPRTPLESANQEAPFWLEAPTQVRSMIPAQDSGVHLTEQAPTSLEQEQPPGKEPAAPPTQTMPDPLRLAGASRADPVHPARVARRARLVVIGSSSLLILALLVILVFSWQTIGMAQTNAAATGAASARSATTEAAQTQAAQGETDTTTAANATATAEAEEPYMAHVPGPGCDQGRLSANWGPGGQQGILCLPDRLRLEGVGSGCPNNDIGFTTARQSDFTVSIGVSNLEGTIGFDIFTMTPHAASYDLIASSYTQVWEADVGENGLDKTLASGAFDLSRTNTFALTVQGTTVRWALNGSQVASYQENTPISVGNISFVVTGCSQTVQVDLQNFSIIPLS